MRRLAWILFLALPLWNRPASAQEPPPAPPPQEEPKKKEEPEEEAPGVARARIKKKLEDTTVHFAFPKAPLVDVTEALATATEIRIRIGAAAQKKLKQRKFKIKYIADRTGILVLSDLAKAANLDYVITDEGVFFDTPKKIKKLRKKLDLAKGERVRLTAADVEKMLVTKRLSIAARDQSLRSVLKFFKDETGVRFVQLPAEDKAEPKVTLKVSDVPLGELLGKVFHPNGLDWIRQGNVILVGPTAAIAVQRAEAEKEGE